MEMDYEFGHTLIERCRNSTLRELYNSTDQDERAFLFRQLKGLDRARIRLQDLTSTSITCGRIDRRDPKAADQIADALRPMIEDGLTLAGLRIADDGWFAALVRKDKIAAKLII